MNGSAFRGVTRAAAIAPIPLTATSSSAVRLIGLTCLNHSTSTRSDSFTTIDQRSNSLLKRPSYHREFQPWESQCSTGPISTLSATSAGTRPASGSRATSASIRTN